MTSFNESIGIVLSILTMAAQALIIFLAGAISIPRKAESGLAKIIGFFSDHAVLFSLIVASVATAGSLFFSEVAHLVPCRLCWFQRIAMYPHVILFAVAVWKKDRGALTTSFILSVIGAAIAGYHVYEQQTEVAAGVCSIFSDISCGQKQVEYFGYVTIPVMALTAFVLILMLALASWVHWRTDSSERGGKTV
ncbi:MAG: disulfide bond formation protein B [Patescibacteria group bacterium]|nr:disulfide bond formation protein B [Patescibacteria group bacterium]MDD5716057.1 disulfide bond formation protein B [Patescibacteria group bacterium]